MRNEISTPIRLSPAMRPEETGTVYFVAASGFHFANAIARQRADEERNRVEAGDRERQPEARRRRNEFLPLWKLQFEQRENDADHGADDEADARGVRQRRHPFRQQFGDATPHQRRGRRPLLGAEQRSRPESG